MGNNRPIIVAYDISNNKTRRNIFKILKSWRIDGQKSVHECRLNQQQAEELFLQLNDPIDQETDRLMMAWLEQNRKVS
ncbi:CRISPR-associated protein Cas2 [Candidatus Magnetomorum sp. HK-1]|nr:CRISPR-associated protein Cas2 [Candidatus Magnetomorum sp. HK-1]